jgi:hypothetical protein
LEHVTSTFGRCYQPDQRIGKKNQRFVQVKQRDKVAIIQRASCYPVDHKRPRFENWHSDAIPREDREASSLAACSGEKGTGEEMPLPQLPRRDRYS